MFLVGLLSWWYSGGLVKRWQLIKKRFESSTDFFSISLLLSTLFSPYKQISAEIATESFNQQIRAFFDKLLSRLIGATVRSCLIIIGLLVILSQFIFGIIAIVFWIFVPLMPILGIIMAMSGPVIL